MAHFETRRIYDFDASPQRVWPAVAQTNLVTELAGVGRYDAVDELQPDGSVLRRASGDKLRPITSHWTEDLGEWVYAHYCTQRRWFSDDASQRVRYTIRLGPHGGGTRAHLRVEIKTSNPVIWAGIQLGMVQRAVQRIIDAQLALIEAEIARSARPDVHHPLAHLPLDPPALDERAQRRLPEARRILQGLSNDRQMSDRLIDYLLRAPDDFLGRIRPLELARAWNRDPIEVVDLFLAAHYAKLVSLRWEILCPRCRNSKTPSLTLETLPREIHCTTCNVDYERDFSHNVELLFAPEPWLRRLPDGAACMLGASTTPHIVVQRHVKAGQVMTIDPPLEPAAYRIRTPQHATQLSLEWDGDDGFPEIVADDSGLAFGPASPPGQIILRNESPGRATVVIEELAWRSDALTGDQAIARAAFRRYCPDQSLRPGDDVRISNVVLMFTDLKGSTSLYERMGDAGAYKLVRDQFECLTDIVKEHHGTLVKTMGDAIIAAFSDGADGIGAAIRLQSGIEEFNRGRDDGGVDLKIGLHQGSCIAVTTDGRLDYFGSMVNLAARLQGESRGGEIVLPTDIVATVDPRTLIPETQTYEMTRDSGVLRGFDHPIDYWRLVMRQGEIDTSRATPGRGPV